MSIEDTATQMTTHYSFIEYSYNPEYITERDVRERLRSLGFNQMTVHKLSGITTWCSEHAIFMVRPSTDVETGKITGIGFVGDYSVLSERIDFEPDDESGMLVALDQYDNRILFIPDDGHTINHTRAQYDVSENIEATCKPMITQCSGIVQDSESDQYVNFLTQDGLGLSPGYRTERYQAILDATHIPIIIRSDSDSGNLHTVLLDTDNIFEIVPKMLSMGIELQPVDAQNIPRTFGDLTHLVVGYQCVAQGDEDSYTIERRAIDVLPGMDWIIRMRSNQLHVKPEILDQHYGTTDHQE